MWQLSIIVARPMARPESGPTSQSQAGIPGHELSNCCFFPSFTSSKYDYCSLLSCKDERILFYFFLVYLLLQFMSGYRIFLRGSGKHTLKKCQGGSHYKGYGWSQGVLGILLLVLVVYGPMAPFLIAGLSKGSQEF